MKKVLSTILAGAMVMGLSSVAFAAKVAPGTVTGSSVQGSGSSKADMDYYVLVTPESDNYVFDEGLPEIYTWGNDDSAPYSEVKVAIVPNVLDADNKWDASAQQYKITDISAHVNTKNVSATVRRNDGGLVDGNAPVVTIKAQAGVRDFDLEDYEVDVDMTIGKYDGVKVTDKEDITITLSKEDGVAYSLTQEIQSDEKYTINKKDGAIANFDEVIDEETRIRAHEYVDVFFKGNYGTDKENMRVVDDAIPELEEFFGDDDVDYYDFVGTPKFASKVKVVIDADPGTFVYEYNAKTGDLTKIDATYESNGWAFTTKALGTYVVTEVEYEDGNVIKDGAESDSSKDETPSKDNPGTGAPEL